MHLAGFITILYLLSRWKTCSICWSWVQVVDVWVTEGKSSEHLINKPLKVHCVTRRVWTNLKNPNGVAPAVFRHISGFDGDVVVRADEICFLEKYVIHGEKL